MNLLDRKILESSYLVQNNAFVLPEKQNELFHFPDVEDQQIPSGWELLKKSGSVISFLDHNKKCFIKIYRRNSFWKSLKRAVGYPRSRRCLAGALRLKELEIPTPEVWYASKYELVTEQLGAENEYLHIVPGSLPKLLDLLIRLHQGGVYHGDLNCRNIYRTADDQYGLIDLDSVSLYSGIVPFRVRMAELGRIISSGLFCANQRKWDDIRSQTDDLCALYEEKSHLPCNRKMVERFVYTHLVHLVKKYGIVFEE